MAISEHEIKMMNLQKQVRQNQVELQDFVKEMNSWEEALLSSLKWRVGALFMGRCRRYNIM
jgi:predicted  nucleic acid-binding Zn-ribbon protein